MTTFAYTAVSIQPAAQVGGVIAGTQDAPDERSLRDELRKKGLIAIEVRPAKLSDALRAALSRDRPRRADAVWFFQTLRLLLSGSVPIEQALSTMHELAPNPRLREVCAAVREKLRGGSSLADAAASVPGLLTAQHEALLRTGHESGRLAHVVTLIDTSIASSERLRRTVTGRLIYPAILLLASIGAVWFLATFVIPKFAGTLQAMGGELPLSTSITMAGAKALVWILPPMLVLAAGAYAFRHALVGPALRAKLSALALRTPLVGPLVWHAQGAVVCDVLGTMLEGGGDVLSGLQQAYEVVSSPALADRLAQARSRVREGTDLGHAFAEAKVLPPMIAAVLQVGMKSGDLVGGLRRCTLACMEKQERITERLLVLLEPAVILFLAGTVGWVVYALVMGMLAMNDIGGL